MTADTTVRITPDVWELIHAEQKQGESQSKTIERVFQERFDIYEKIMKEIEVKEAEGLK